MQSLDSITTHFSSVDPADQIAVFDRSTFVVRPKPYNRRNYCKIGLILGNVRLYYADREIEIDRPSLIFSNPLVPYAFEPLSSKQEGYFCLFSPEYLKNWSARESPLFRIGADPVFFVDQVQQEYISGIYRNMMRELDSDYPHKFDLARHHLMLLLHEAMKIKPATTCFPYKKAAAARTASLFLTLLDRQFPIEHPQRILQLRTASDYATHLSVHVNTLNRAVKEVTGKTTTDHITGRIIDEAKVLLINTNWNIADIAYCLGFEYLTYFNNFFKKYTGVTPGYFR
ncbi:helix-turn-helix domain-containing protein [Chitinophaga silvisoli]|uniref:AraC family transcriptional regulator n=1 Tax=Chitinophaga silvisoli TaxID=2291814 RepID=A0A3E1NZX0_9BACT|nr:helix-turn-helix transcriptional regulator [Chitinophaga silvisoli]RFM33440.1 AraC family transcriptional regulator [Chitinophaga silvisoli]